MLVSRCPQVFDYDAQSVIITAADAIKRLVKEHPVLKQPILVYINPIITTLVNRIETKQTLLEEQETKLAEFKKNLKTCNKQYDCADTVQPQYGQTRPTFQT